MTSTPYMVMIQWWPFFLDIFIACLAGHFVFYFYLWFKDECKRKWQQRKSKIVGIRLIPGTPQKS